MITYSHPVLSTVQSNIKQISNTEQEIAQIHPVLSQSRKNLAEHKLYVSHSTVLSCAALLFYQSVLDLSLNGGKFKDIIFYYTYISTQKLARLINIYILYT